MKQIKQALRSGFFPHPPQAGDIAEINIGVIRSLLTFFHKERRRLAINMYMQVFLDFTRVPHKSGF